MRLNRSTNSAMEYQTVVHRSEFLSEPFKTAGRVVLEDRRPASNGDPYQIAAVIIKTTKEALCLNGDSDFNLKAMEKSIAFFIFLFQYHRELIPIFFKEAKDEMKMSFLGVNLSFPSAALDP